MTDEPVPAFESGPAPPQQDAAPPAPPTTGAPPLPPAPPVVAPPAPTTVAAPDPLVGLPTGSGRVLSAAFDLLTSASTDLRGGGLYFGAVLFLTVAPLVVIVLGIVAHGTPLEDLLQGASVFDLGTDAGAAATEALGATLFVVLFLAIIGYFVISIEGQAIAILLLAGRIAERPISLDEALVRSRRVFWRLVRAAIIVAIPSTIAQFVVLIPLSDGSQTSEGPTLLATAVSTIVIMPFTYYATGIVLGDVNARQAVRRSLTLFRVRKRLGVTVAIFAAVAQYLLVFGAGVGGDILTRVVAPLGLSPDGGIGAIAVIGVLGLVFVFALGSLLFLVSAISVAPQVIAFLSLTRYTGGLDAARADDQLAVRHGRVAAAPAVAPTPVTGYVVSAASSFAGPVVAPVVAPVGLPPAYLTPTPSPRTYWQVERVEPRRRFRWFTLPLRLGVIAGVLCMILGLAQLASTPPGPPGGTYGSASTDIVVSYLLR